MSDPNLLKLRLVMGLFRLRATDVRRATRYSKGFVSMVLAGKLQASEEFWMRLNNVLPKLVSQSDAASCVFDIQPSHVPVDDTTLEMVGSGNGAA